MRRRGLLASAVAAGLPGAALAEGGAVLGAAAPSTPDVRPVGLSGRYRNRLDATFGWRRPEATIRSKADLDRIAYYRYIYGDAATTGDGTDGLYGNYRSRHRDYPDEDPRALHVVTEDRLVLKARCGLGTAVRADCSDGNVESGIVRFALTVPPGSAVEMRCRMPRGRYAWPAFWLNPGTQSPSPAGGPPVRSVLDWPPEIDIFDQFGSNGEPPGHALISGTVTNGRDAEFGNPRDTFRDPAWGNKPHYTTRDDLTAADHVYGLDWGKGGTLRFLLDGKVYRERYYEWNSKGGVPAHLIVSLQVGAKFNDLRGMTDQDGKPGGWDWPIDYVRVWEAPR